MTSIPTPRQPCTVLVITRDLDRGHDICNDARSSKGILSGLHIKAAAYCLR